MKLPALSKPTAILTAAIIVVAAAGLYISGRSGSNEVSKETSTTNTSGVSVFAQAGRDALVRCGTEATDCLDNAAIAAYKDGGADGLVEFADAVSLIGDRYCSDWLLELGSKLYVSDGAKAFTKSASTVCQGYLLAGGFIGIGESASPAEIPVKSSELCSAVGKSDFACGSLLAFSAMSSSLGDISKALGFCDGLKDQGAARTCGMTLTVYQFNADGKNNLKDCAKDLTPASAGCANYAGTIGNREGQTLTKACDAFKGIVLDDCQYGFGFTAGAQQKDKVKIEDVCGDSEWCTRGVAWGVSAAEPTYDVIKLCAPLFDSLKLACEAGAGMKDYRDTEVPNRPVPLSHDNYASAAPKLA